jgi:hypothetical protein
MDLNKWGIHSKGKEDNMPSKPPEKITEELERIRKELGKRGMDSNVANEVDTRVSATNVIDQELKAMIEEEIQNATKELMDEQKMAIRSVVEEHKRIIRDVLEQEKLFIRSNKEDIRQSIIRLGMG